MSFELTTLGEFATIQGGYAYKSAEFQSSGNWPVLKIKNVRAGRIDYTDLSFVSDQIAEATSKWCTKVGDVLISMTGSGPSAPDSLVGRVGKVRMSDPPALINQRVGRLILKDEKKIDLSFLYHLLSLPDIQQFLVTNSTGSANQVNISSKTIEIVPCPKIDLYTSSAISEFLDSLDDRITLLRETNATLEAIAQALFKSWFVDFDPVRAKMEGCAPAGMDEATAALFPDGFETSELGEVPRGWRVAALGSVCSYLNRGISPKYLESGGVLVLNQKCIRDFSIDYGKGRRHDPLQRKIDGREVLVGDVLVNSTGVGTLGRVAQVLQLSEPKTIVDSHVTVVRAGPDLGWPYLGQFMARKQPEIEAMGEGSTGQTELNRGKLAEVKVLVPGAMALSAFNEIVIPLKQRIAVNEKQAQTLATLRDTLLPRLISGTLRLPEVQAALEAQA